MGQARQTVERLQLGLTLQRLRTEATKTQEEAAEIIGRSAARLSQIENGRGALGVDELARLLDFYGVSNSERTTLLALGKASRRRQTRQRYMDTLPDAYVRFMDLLAAASRISWYECGVIPGLAQSPSYVSGIIQASSSIRPDEETTGRIAFRQSLQQRVLTSGKAEQIDIIFTEDALLHVVGDESVMREQVLHLLQLAELPRVNIRVVGLDTRNNPGLGGGMVSLTYDSANPIMFTPAIYGPATYYDQPAHTERMQQLFERIAGLAWSPEESRAALIAFLARSA